MSVVVEKAAETPGARPASEPMLGITTVPAPIVAVPDAYAGTGPLAELRARFRLHGPEDPAPPAPRLFAVTFWAAALGLLGMVPAGRLAMTFVLGDPWLPLTGIAIGLLGVVAVAGAFASIHQAVLPVKLLGVASGLLVLNYLLAYLLL